MTGAVTVPRSSRALLDHILEQPGLLAAVRSLQPLALARLIEHVGLEDAGELLALASGEQLQRVFDEDLWKSDRPGADERFDAGRFGLYLEVLVEQGVSFAAKKLSEMDEDLVTLGLCRLLFVIDIEQLATRMSSADRDPEDDQLDKQLESGLYFEFEQYRVISRDSRSWDAILSVLVELNANDFPALSRLLERCCEVSTEYIEDNGGLYNVLTSEEMMESDAAAAREDRRERAGYVAPSDALSFLRLARDTPFDRIAKSEQPDPVTRAHFRAAGLEPLPVDLRIPLSAAPSRREPGLQRLLEAMRAADVLPAESRPRALRSGKPGYAEPLLTRAMRIVRERDPALYSKRALELAYLSNLLLSGCGTPQRRLRPVEAAEAALAVCNLGAERHPGGKAAGSGAGKRASRSAEELVALLRDADLVKLFRMGFHLLCRKDPPSAVETRPDLTLLRLLLERQGLA
jgi:hypothetical protein